ncbi:MAG: aminotransferase class I/II-fold pyridoxal phosphate-dependent enzyme [Candidatus Gastranaerophilales bacterium]|nr:aminotransferase class I/II-fold pyridoxal phosphate-dependent enzyme [Candidatus Gastranaerophilales bacterium]
MSIIKLLSKKTDKILFTTPSHSQKPMFNTSISNMYNIDYSEVNGFDNLSNPKSSIFYAQAKASEIMNAKQTFFITQGATTAILSAMKALINPGDKVLVARNCHKSVFNGLILTAGIVDWFIPETDENWGIYTHIDCEKLESTFNLNQYKAFIMTSPTYEGINSDIEKIAKLCKKFNIYLIVDEAHGTLNNFSSNLPKSAMEQGADVSINSLHKTAGALNQCALLNIGNNIQNIDIETFQRAINIFQTSSPSYPLLSNIEHCINFLNSEDGNKEINGLFCEIDKLKKDLNRFGVQFYVSENHDQTKILARKEGISGYDLSEIMFDEFNIEDEMNNAISCLYLTGIGTTKSKLEKLKNGLKKVITNPSYEFVKTDFQPFPLTKIQPVDTFNREYMYVNKENSLLKISNKTIMPYPPGIGLLYPGEAIQKWHLDYLDKDVEIMV